MLASPRNVSSRKFRSRSALASLVLAFFLISGSGLASAPLLAQEGAAPEEAPAKETPSLPRLEQDLDRLLAWEQWDDQVRKAVAEQGPIWLLRLGLFFFVLLVTFVVTRIAAGTVRRLVDASRANVSQLLRGFLVNVTTKTLWFLGFLLALAQVDIDLGPVLAGVGIAGFILGFALQDTLGNFAAGLMVLLYRPYDVGHAIEAAGVTGKVTDMSLVSTTIHTFDNQRLVVPNGKIWGGVIRNINAEPTRRVDMVFGCGYDDDPRRAEEVLREIVTGHELVLDDPEPVIRLHELADSSVNFVVRPWVATDDYWTVYWDVHAEVKRRFDAEGLTIPYPQRDLHVHRPDGHRPDETLENEAPEE